MPVIRRWTTPDGRLPDPFETVYSFVFVPILPDLAFLLDLETGHFLARLLVRRALTDTRRFIPHMQQLAVSSLPMSKTVIADAGYGSEENYLYAVGEEKEPRFDFCIPYGSNMKNS